MDTLSLANPLVATYTIAATLMILKVVAMAWLTVWRMTNEKGGFRAPEDIKKTPLNPEPNAAQLAPNERVERVRRIMQNDLENVPFFLVAGLLYILTQPSLVVAQWLLYGYVATRFLHFAAYFTGQDPRHPRRHLDGGLADPDLHHRAHAAGGTRRLARIARNRRSDRSQSSD